MANQQQSALAIQLVSAQSLASLLQATLATLIAQWQPLTVADNVADLSGEIASMQEFCSSLASLNGVIDAVVPQVTTS